MAKTALLSKALDGCHRFGWVINMVTTLVMLAYFTGGLKATVDALDKRVGSVESTVVQILLGKR